jgi:hypothetical protein
MDSSLVPVSSRVNNVIKTNDGMVIQQNDKIHTLNYTAYEIYELCDGNNSIGDIFKVMRSRYYGEEIDGLIENLFNKLQDSGLIKLS